MGQRLDKKREFIKALAKYLVGNQAGKSIALEMEQKRPPSPLPSWAKEWAEVRSRSSLFGYPTVEEATEALEEFLM